MTKEPTPAADAAAERTTIAQIVKFPIQRRGHALTFSAAKGTIPQRDGGAEHPRAFSASCITTKVSDGKRTKPRQLKAAPYVRPVSLATAATPPSSSITSAVETSSRSMESGNNPNFLDSQYPNLIDTKKFGFAPSSGGMPTVGTDSDADVAFRCRALTRLYAGGNSSDFAEKIGVPPTRWNNVEVSGKLSKDLARRVYKRFPEVSLDWVFRGKDDAYSRARGDEFQDAYRAEVEEAKVTKKRGSAKKSAGRKKLAS